VSDAPTPGPLGDRVLHGLRWVVASTALQQALRAIVAIILARLLVPHDYGLAVLVLVFESLVLVFSDLALGAALVQRPTLSEHDRSTAFWISVAAGVTFTVSGVALSGAIADLYGQPDVQPLFAVLSISFIVTSLAVTHEALMVRDMRFRSLELRLMAGTIVSGAVGITIAALGGGPWAIIAQQLAFAVMSTILLWAFSPWRPRLVFSRASLRSLGSFSAFLVGHRLLFYVHRNADNFIVGRFVGASALGAYAVAYNVMLAPFSKIAGPLQRVLWPAFSRIQDDPARILSGWLRVTRVVAMVAVPSLMGIVAVAPDFVPVVLGDQWESAVTLIQVLAWVGLLQALQSLNIDILQARDRTSTIFAYSVFFTVAHVVAFSVGVQWGVVGVAVAYAISSTLVEPVLTVLTARAIGASPWTFVRNLAGIFQAGLVMLAAVLGARLLLIDADVGEAGRLALLMCVGAAVFLPLCLWRTPELRRELRVVRSWIPRVGEA
jgi:O-antigen/teichoic acid export membrane protein